MSEFILLFRGGEAPAGHSPEKLQAHMQQWMEWMGRLQQEGKFIDAQPLKDTGKLVFANKKIVAEGPFMTGKNVVGGYMICKAADYDEAITIANGCPILEFENATVEIREIQEMKM